MGLYDALDWISLNAQNYGVYSIVLGSDQKVSNISLDYGGKRVTVSLKAAGGERKVTYDTNNPSYALFTVKEGAAFTLEENVVLSGLQNARVSLVKVDGGTFFMNGGAIRDNKTTDSGGGVYVNAGAFTMNNGTISGNTASGDGGGVRVGSGSTFIMNNGTISRNTASTGGGVYVGSGSTFIMNNGTISGNTASNGGGVCVNGGTFTKSNRGGIIYGSNSTDGQANEANYGHAAYNYNSGYPQERNTTARVATAMDTKKRGAEGGWE
jgi:hypothetical protein